MVATSNSKSASKKRFASAGFVTIVGVALTAYSAQQPDNNVLTFIILGATIVTTFAAYGMANRKST